MLSMLNLSFLTFPLVAALVTFGFAVAIDYQTVFVHHFSVPYALKNATGYDSDVVIQRLGDDIREIAGQAKSELEAREIRMSGDHSAVNVIGDFLGVTPLIRITQETAGLIPFTFEGEMVSVGREVEIRLRGHDNHHGFIFLTARSPLDQIHVAIRRLAYEVMQEVDPYLLAAYQFRQDYRKRDFTETLAIVQREADKSDSEFRKWVLNLWGIVLYQQADRAGAMEKFKEALALDSDFLSARLNLGVVTARRGDNVKAIDYYREVVEKGAHQVGHGDAHGAGHGGASGSADTVAAALTEWGFSLALLGRPEEAFHKFEEAHHTSPSFAEVYTSWAEVLSVLNRREEAAKMSAKALELAPTEVIYTENLIGPTQNPPAEAVVH